MVRVCAKAQAVKRISLDMPKIKMKICLSLNNANLSLNRIQFAIERGYLIQMKWFLTNRSIEERI